MEDGVQLLWEVAMGVGLAACAGLRAFLPLFLLSLAGKLGWVGLARGFDWLASWPALVVFGVAVVTEVLSDKIPLVDNLLDVLQGVIKPGAGTILAASVVTELAPLEAMVLGIIVGGSTAGVVHVAKAKVRLFSSATTAGLGNPLLSAGEDLASFGGSILAMLMPFVFLVAVIATLVLIYVGMRRFRLRAARLGRL